METKSDWGWLPDLVLASILNKLVSLSDYIRFSAVCKQWYSVAADPNMQKLRTETCGNQLPLLMVPTKDGSIEKRSLYNFTRNKYYDVELSVPFNRRCCGSCHGWLALAMDDLAIILFNPFLGTRIVLPRLQLEEPHYHAQYFIKKVILSANPTTNSNDYEVAAIYGDMQDLAFLKAGQKSWTHVEIVPSTQGIRYNSPFLVSDAIYRNGILHCVNYHSRITPAVIVSIDTGPNSNGNRVKIIGRWVVKKDETIEKMGIADAYLVESSNGELLVIRRFLSYHYDHEISHKVSTTTRLEVYKVVEGGQKLKLERINDMGDDALFLGDNNSFSLLASDYPGCRPNCIYFTDDYLEFWYPYGPRDMAIFNLNDESFESHYVPNPLHKLLPPPIWITPTPKFAGGGTLCE